MRARTALLVSTMVLAIVPTMRLASATTRMPFVASLAFTQNVCVDIKDVPSNTCRYWDQAWVSNGVVHIRGWTGVLHMNGTVSGTGVILHDDLDISWAAWYMSTAILEERCAVQSWKEAFQVWGTINGYTIYVTASVDHGRLSVSTFTQSNMFRMTSGGTDVVGSVAGVDWDTQTLLLEGSMFQFISI